ncbi:leucine zipper transcription factor-like protein 1 [Anneissia japonica]|uniref:leucine zipper transcription factor-like protein 1 n=1 Tax=Anneissia japonica TaxID=1529436 RepID=UPI0014258D69|nr:leucine zipper transcription factor-like protein 1 [Anneissia japonica]
MSGNLGLNEHHHEVVVNYLRFSRYLRTQNLKAVDSGFQELKDSRLTEDTFTADEVSEMLDGLQVVLRGEVETELINNTHTNVLLLRQLFQQAEKWHLLLQANISELENRELIEMIANFEDQEFSGKAATAKPTFEMRKLNPLEGGGVQLLQNEIDRLTSENEKLKARLQQVEAKASEAFKDKSQLEADLQKTREELGMARNQQPSQASYDTSDLENQISSVKSEMEKNLLLSSTKASDLQGNLAETAHKLLEVQEQLRWSEKERDKKFSQTGAYKNLKSMLQTKNKTIKELREKLRQYEADD